MNNKALSKITFIGGGNMARSLIGGLISDGYKPEHIFVCDPNPDQLSALQNWFPIRCESSGEKLLADTDCVVFAVKPQIMQQAITENRDALQKNHPLILSIAAGIRVDSISRWLKDNYAIIRCVPNTPALVQAGATALFANKQTQQIQRDFAESIMRAVGITLWLEEESHLDTVTALSGSGPAYFFLLMEAMQAAAEKMGLNKSQARLLTLQTGFGAAKIALEDGEDPSVLRQRVTSKRGTTESALNVLHEAGFISLIEQALAAAKARGIELGELLDNPE